MKTFIITKCCGGLGNQMFQYAAGRALALRYDVPLLLDLTWYDDMTGCTPRRYCLDIFPSLSKNSEVVRQAKVEEIHFIKYNDVSFGKKIKSALLHRPRPCGQNVYVEPLTLEWQKTKKICPPAYLEGYWQSTHYFEDYEGIIRRDFSFPVLPSNASIAIKDEILCNTNSVALHIRRGDYAHNPTTQSVHGLCSHQYYINSMNYIKRKVPDAHFFIFSDDPIWVRQNFAAINFSTTIVDIHSEHNAYNDMYLMSLCKHHIIANSSFSWWGAWLGNQKDLSITCAPAQWFVSQNYSHKNPCPKHWERI